MYIIFGILKECWHLFFQMSSYLICGFLIAGLIHIFLKPETISTHLGNPGFLSILKAVLFGVPLPLCSCGVLPPADSFYRAGASKGSV
ncbi:MAG TPA: permease, partial [bacterium]|nr:permease [bacterium]